MSKQSSVIWILLSLAMFCGCGKEPVASPARQSTSVSNTPQSPAAQPVATVPTNPELTTQTEEPSVSGHPKNEGATGGNDVATTNPESKAASLSPKEMLKLSGTGVVVVKIFDALGDTVGFGSGCIIDQGLILTNYHVVSPAVTAQIQPRGTGGALLGTPLNVVGVRAIDEKNDLAVLAVDGLPENLHQFALADPSHVEQYDKVFAIGHPDGLKFSTSAGFVNSLLKTSDLPEQIQAYLKNPDTEWIQTDAVIAGGSSGGPLLDESGKIVGINTLRVGQRAGLAVRVRHVRDLLTNLAETAQPLPVPDSDVLTTKSIAEIKRGYDREFQQFMTDLQLMRTAGNLERLKELIRKNNPGPACIQRCVHLMRDHHGQSETHDAFRLCAYILSTNGGRMNSGRKYLDDFLEQAANDPRLILASYKMIVALNGLNYSNSLEQYLRSVMAGEYDDHVKAAAGMVLVTAMAGEQNDAVNAEMIELATAINQQYGELQLRGGPIKESIEPILEAQAFSIGGIAAEIEGKDSEGKEMKLSHYRGKVVVLDFWADWCPHCRNMYPHEREMIERLKEKPFALLGVNGDEPDRARRVISSGTVTWRSWLDGPSGPIGERYKIAAWPTTYVLDKDGRIRFKDLRGDDLEAAVNSLLDDVSLMRPHDVLAADSEWKFHPMDDANSPADWRDSEFDDSSWNHGPGPFGYGQVRTRLELREPGRRPLATLFRKVFDRPATELSAKLLLTVRCQDGVVVFLNGNEIYRNNLTKNAAMDAGAIARGTNKDASGATIQIDSSLLKPTGNCIAVELHQFSRYSTQAYFQLTLGTTPDLSGLVDKATSAQQAEICQVFSQAGVWPGGAEILEKLQASDSMELKVAAAIAAALNQLPVTAKLSDPETQQSLALEVGKLNEEAWDVVRRGDLSDFQYADALRRARGAYTLLSVYQGPLKQSLEVVRNTVGVALYRAKLYDESQEKLKESIGVKGDNPVDVAYLTLGLWRTDKTAQAMEQKKHFSKLLASDGWMHDTTAQEAQHEVDDVIKE